MSSLGQIPVINKPIPSPLQMYKYLDQYVVGLEIAKCKLSVGVFNHYRRLFMNSQNPGVEIEKSNILISGPTGSGKTHLIRTLAKMLDVPLAICDATTLTEAGYVGDDVENVLSRLYNAANQDIARTQVGIIYIDEIDKLSKPEGENRSITRDVSGEGVQQSLLKLVEGCVASVPPQGGRKHPQQETLSIDTSNILFIVGGAFTGLDKIIEARVKKAKTAGLGFKPEDLSAIGSPDKRAEQATKIPLVNVVNMAETADFVRFGMIPEFIGRFPVRVCTEELSESQLRDILIKPKNALVKQFQAQLLELTQVEFSDESLDAIVQEAKTLGTGARGLRNIIEETLLITNFKLPEYVNVTAEMVRDRQKRLNELRSFRPGASAA